MNKIEITGNQNPTYLIYLVLLLLASPALLCSQTVVKGKVMDAVTEEGLIGASVLVANTSNGTVTDVDGGYILNIPKNTGDTIALEISYIGYTAQAVELIIMGEELIQDILLKLDALQLQDIIVSANKRNQSSQKVPMSITNLTHVQLRRSGAQQFRDYASGISNLSFNTQGAGLYGRFDNGISIRGITGANTTAMYLDETPMPENIDPRLVDIGRVEMLKGPQGTLYGSGNMGGAVKVITNQPNVKQAEGSLALTFSGVKEGDLNYDINGVINLPLSDKIAFRAAGFYDFESGVFDRIITPDAVIMNRGSFLETDLPDQSTFTITTDGCPDCNPRNVYNIDNETNYGFHASLGFYPTEKISIVPKVILQNQSGDGYDFAEGQVGNFEQIRVSGVPEYFEDDWKHYSLTAEIELGAGKIISSTSFLDRHILEVDDDGESFNRLFEIYDGDKLLDFFAANISKDINTTQFNQEIRFQSDLGGQFEFTAGLFYLNGYEDERWLSKNTGAATYISLYIYEDMEFAEYIEEELPHFYDFGGIYKSGELAFFGEAYYAITDKLKATLGLRFFNATKSLDTYETGFYVDDEYLEVKGEVGEYGINPKLNLTYQFDKNKMAYATVAKGYRLGDLNEIVPEVFCGDELAEMPGGVHPRFYGSDFLWNYEMGFKGTWLNGKVTTNAAIFYNDWQNLQQTRTLECGYSFVSNVGSAHTTGLELDINAKASRHFKVGSGMGFLNAIIDESGPNLEAEKGDRITFTPNLTANINAEYATKIRHKGRVYIYGEIQHVGERFNTFSPEDVSQSHLIFDAYTIINARIGVQYPNQEFSIFVNNLTDTAANFGNIFSVAVDVPGRPRYATNRPITIGVQSRVYF